MTKITRTGACYCRVSTEEQSTAHQERAINDWLAERGLKIDVQHRYIDEGWSRSDDDVRPAFRRLLSMVEQGRVNWIVVFNSDRFGHATNLRFMRTLATLEARGVALYSTSEPEMGNLASSEILPMILGTLNSSRSTAEIQNKALKAVEGIITHAANAPGVIPYGFDKACFSPDGREKWRLILERHEGKTPIKTRLWPDGRAEEYRGAGDPKRDDKDYTRLVPSVRKDRQQAVRLAYEMLTEGKPLSQIAKTLNSTPGINPPPNPLAKWNAEFLRGLLKNPLYYLGVPVRFKHSHAKHMTLCGGRATPVAKLPGQRLPKGRLRDRSEWLVPDERGEGLVTEEVWEKAYARLTSNPQKWKTNRSPEHWLNGFVYCGGCGAKMRSCKKKLKLTAEDKRLDRVRHKVGYACASYYEKARRTGPVCRHNFCHSWQLEAVIVEHMKATGEKLDLLTKAPAAIVLEMAEELAAETDRPVSDFLPRDHLVRQAAVRLDDGVTTFIKTLSAMWKEVSAAGRGKRWGAKEIAAAWEAQHRKRGRADEKALLVAEEALSLMLDSYASLRPGVAKDRLRAKVEAQEETIAELRQRAVLLSHKLDDAAGLVERCREQLADVRRLLLSEDKESVARRSAAVLGRAVRRLTVFFRDEDRGKGQERSVPVSVQVLPVTGECRDVLIPARGRWRSRTSRVTT